MGRIRVGTASWTDKTLLASGWYPDDAKSAEERLGFYASRFPIVEVDSTYYTPPNERNSELWAQRTPDGFTFNIKAFSLLTQHPTRAAALYKDLRPEDATGQRLRQGPRPGGRSTRSGSGSCPRCDPLHQAGKLGALLFQFPQWFPIGRRNKEYVLECKRRCDPVPICVEFRNKTWMSERQRQGDARLPHVVRACPMSASTCRRATRRRASVIRRVRWQGARRAGRLGVFQASATPPACPDGGAQQAASGGSGLSRWCR